MKIIFLPLFIGLHFASIQIPGEVQSKPIKLVGGLIHTIVGDDLLGDLLFENGTIISIGSNGEAMDAEIIDITGKHVYPGFIAASTTLGLVEINAVRATRDYNETGSFNPNVRVERAFNPDSELIPITRSNGVLTAHIIPKGGRISGSSALMYLDGWTWEDCIVETPTGIHINWPSMDLSSNRWDKANIEDKKIKIKDSIRELDQFINGVLAYKKKKENLEGIEVDLRLESMLKLLNKEIPAFIHAQKFSQIDAAISFSIRYGIRMILVGGADSYQLSDRLKENNIPVIYEHPFSLPLRRWESYDVKYKVPFELYRAGVKFCISYSSSTFQAAHQRSLPYASAIAVSFGLPQDEGLKAITLYPAEILGVEDRLGSIEVGKEATLFVSSGDPLEMDSVIEMAFIKGKSVDLNDRHKILSKKYLEKYRQLKLTD